MGTDRQLQSDVLIAGATENRATERYRLHLQHALPWLCQRSSASAPLGSISGHIDSFWPAA